MSVDDVSFHCRLTPEFALLCSSLCYNHISQKEKSERRSVFVVDNFGNHVPCINYPHIKAIICSEIKLSKWKSDS